MWEFVKYCLICLGIVTSAAFGNNPKGLTVKTGVTGILTLYVLIGLAVLIFHLLNLLVNKVK
jgi:hypothetical protein